MDSYRQTRSLERKRAEVARELRRAIRALTARQRREAILRAAVMPIGPRQELQRAIEEHQAADGMLEAMGL